jgi:hypothetical protein
MMTSFGWRPEEIYKDRYVNDRTPQNRKKLEQRLIPRLVATIRTLRVEADLRLESRIVEHILSGVLSKAEDYPLSGTFTNFCISQIHQCLRDLDESLARLTQQAKITPFVVAGLSQNISRIASAASVPGWCLLECLGLGKHTNLDVFDLPSAEAVTAAKQLGVDPRLIRSAMKYSATTRTSLSMRESIHSRSLDPYTAFELELEQLVKDLPVLAHVFKIIDRQLTGFGLPNF